MSCAYVLLTTLLCGLIVISSGASRHLRRDKRDDSDTCSPDANCIDDTCSADGCVHGCSNDTVHGPFCNETCSEWCKEGRCEQETGKCEECLAERYYGDTCNVLCPVGCCSRPICDSGQYGYCYQNGTCQHGCRDGYSGANCCSDNCLNKQCSAEGKCVDGCVEGYTGAYCSQSCPEGCAKCKAESPDDCDECKDGYWGTGCAECSLGCQNPTCNKTDGSCSPCKPYYYKKKCNERCDSCLNGDCRVNGKCEQGCINDGYWGPTCEWRCNNTCKDRICHLDNGTCVKCPAGRWGPQCDQRCPYNCKEKVCDQVNSVCIRGCHDSYTGDFCWKECPRNCQDSKCDQRTEACLHGCVSKRYGGEQCGEDRLGVYVAVVLCLVAFIVVLVISICCGAHTFLYAKCTNAKRKGKDDGLAVRESLHNEHPHFGSAEVIPLHEKQPITIEGDGVHAPAVDGSVASQRLLDDSDRPGTSQHHTAVADNTDSPCIQTRNSRTESALIKVQNDILMATDR